MLVHYALCLPYFKFSKKKTTTQKTIYYVNTTITEQIKELVLLAVG